MASLAVGAADRLTELTVKLDLQKGDYIEGERINAVVDVANASPDPIDARGPDSPDRLILELYRASDRFQYEKISDKPFVEPFALLSGEGQLLDVHFAEHFKIEASTRYFARAVLIHKRTRYESSLKSFNVAPGLRCGGAVQMFSNKEGLRREFELVHWGRDQVEHIPEGKGFRNLRALMDHYRPGAIPERDKAEGVRAADGRGDHLAPDDAGRVHPHRVLEPAGCVRVQHARDHAGSRRGWRGAREGAVQGVGRR